MLIVGILLILFGWIFGVPLLVWIGAFVAIVGAVLLAASFVGRPIGSRRYW